MGAPEDLLPQVWRHRGKIVGGAVGLLVGWLVLELGFLRTLFLLLCGAAGYVLGERIDRGERVETFVGRFRGRSG